MENRNLLGMKKGFAWCKKDINDFNCDPCLFSISQIRDVDAVKTTVFKGMHLFHWISTGSRAEVEFHGEYQQMEGTFRAEYSYIKPEENKPI